jgi:hypothetical protein
MMNKKFSLVGVFLALEEEEGLLLLVTNSVAATSLFAAFFRGGVLLGLEE